MFVILHCLFTRILIRLKTATDNEIDVQDEALNDHVILSNL